MTRWRNRNLRRNDPQPDSYDGPDFTDVAFNFGFTSANAVPASGSRFFSGVENADRAQASLRASGMMAMTSEREEGNIFLTQLTPAMRSTRDSHTASSVREASQRGQPTGD